MSSLAHLRSEHAELVRIAQELTLLLDRPTPPPTVDLFNVRRRLTSTLLAHLKAEDWVLYPPLLASPDAKVAETARCFVEEMGGLAAAFSAFIDKWDAIRIGEDWVGYQGEARAILAALSNRIVRENRELYPLLEQHDRAA